MKNIINLFKKEPARPEVIKLLDYVKEKFDDHFELGSIGCNVQIKYQSDSFAAGVIDQIRVSSSRIMIYNIGASYNLNVSEQKLVNSLFDECKIREIQKENKKKREEYTNFIKYTEKLPN
jgi:hypothetical protein